MSFSRTPSTGLATLLEMIAVRRPCGSKTERKWIKQHLLPLGLTADSYGNLHKRIGTAPVLWSCHTDTVHRKGGAQAVAMDGAGMVTLAKAETQSNCLGADDTAGVWLMSQMIQAGKPGLYIFHRAEECGGLGSSHIAYNTPELLAGIEFAIALDRRGTQDVITHQAAGRCASDAFAKSLAAGLGGLDYKPSSAGIFTDTANYTDLIGECTNLSVGYYGEHTAKERLDTRHLNNLLDALLGLDLSTLVAERKPGEAEEYDLSKFNWAGSHWDEENTREATPGARQRAIAAWDWEQERGTAASRSAHLRELVEMYPHEVADWLDDMGINPEDIEEAILVQGAALRVRRLSRLG